MKSDDHGAHDRYLAQLPHLATLAWLVIPFGNLLGPLVAWGLVRGKSEFADAHGREAANCQFSLFLYGVAAYVLIVIGVGYLVMILLALTSLVQIGIGTWHARTGRLYRSSVALPLLRDLKGIPRKSTGVGALVLVGTIVFSAWSIVQLTGDGFCSARRHIVAPPVPTRVDRSVPLYALVSDPATPVEGFEYAQLAMFVYHNSPTVPSGWRWTSLMAMESQCSGFFAEAFEYTNGQVVIAYRGTEPNDIRDWATDLALALRFTPMQFRDAAAFFFAVREHYPGKGISLTGHSLGGALAQYIAAWYAVPAQTFNAFGVARLFTGIPSMVTGARVHPRVDKNLILNHVAAYDFVSAATVPFTFLDVVRTTYAGITFGQSQQHIGCRIVWVAPWWRFYHLLLWHSIAQLWNDVEVTASEGLPEAQISRCPQYEPRWFEYFYN